jgi:hypothetical protein
MHRLRLFFSFSLLIGMFFLANSVWASIHDMGYLVAQIGDVEIDSEYAEAESEAAQEEAINQKKWAEEEKRRAQADKNRSLEAGRVARETEKRAMEEVARYERDATEALEQQKVG